MPRGWPPFSGDAALRRPNDGRYRAAPRNIAEMVTGEGKTLVATLPAYLNALEGKGVHVVTVNDYLARRDMEWMGPLYLSLGLTVNAIQSQMDAADRQKAYACDITYGTNNEFGFDYLRDNMRNAAREIDAELVGVDEVFVGAGKSDVRGGLEAVVDRLRRVVVKHLQAYHVGRVFHELLVAHRLGERDVAAHLDLPAVRAAGEAGGIFAELKEIRAQEAEAGFNRAAQGGDRRHHPDDREHPDRDAQHGEQGAELVHSDRAEGNSEDLREGHGRKQAAMEVPASLVPQRHHWIEARRAPGGGETGNDAGGH